MVFFDIGWQGSQIANIRIDYQRGIKKLIAYLYSLGHRSLGFAGYRTTCSTPSKGTPTFGWRPPRMRTRSKAAVAPQERSWLRIRRSPP